MGRRSPTDPLRVEAGAVAARALASGDASDFDDARDLAVAELNLDERRQAPSNADIHAALIDYLTMFHAERQAALLDRLRRAALSAMALLTDFDPRLSGAVWDGTALPDTAVSLHLLCDEPEAVIRFLSDNHLAYREAEEILRFPGDKKPVGMPRFDLRRGDIAIELVVFPRAGVLRTPLSVVDQRPVERADRERLQRLLDSGELFPARGTAAA